MYLVYALKYRLPMSTRIYLPLVLMYDLGKNLEWVSGMFNSNYNERNI